jgi:LmbE family N-acetylglucosaminyl deacetylase
MAERPAEKAPARTRRWRSGLPAAGLLAAGPLVALVLSLGSCSGAGVRAGSTELVLSPEDRLLVLAPHPDDEVLGAGGVLQAAVRRGLPVRVVFLTHGDANEWSFIAHRKRPTLRPSEARAMGAYRQREALEATARLSVPPQDVVFLGYPDRGTLRIWGRHWGEGPPHRGVLTRAREVPYDTARSTRAPHRGEEILADLRDEIASFRPTRIFVSHPADRHPDHAALYLFTRAALWDLALEPSPVLHPYLIHFPRWPWPLGFRPEGALEPPAGLAGLTRWKSWPLESADVEGKRHALRAHATQYGYSARRLLPLVRSNELYGDLPPLRLVASGEPVEIVDAPVAGPADHAQGPVAVPLVLTAGLTPLPQPDADPPAVDLERLLLSLEDGMLVATARMVHPLGGTHRLLLSLSGHRADRPFETMPKIEVQVSPRGHSVRNGNQRLPAGTARVVRERSQVTIILPLAALGDPERLLLGARLASERAEDRLPWRVVELR